MPLPTCEIRKVQLTAKTLVWTPHNTKLQLGVTGNIHITPSERGIKLYPNSDQEMKTVPLKSIP